MTRQELYLSIYQIIGTFNADARLDGVTDFDREIFINVARNSGGNISHITTEFTGLRSRYLCSILFDGNGDQDTHFDNFAMPKVKLNGRQRCLVMLACLDFLIANKVLNADIAYFVERLTHDQRPSTVGVMQHYARVRCVAQSYISDHPEYLRGTSDRSTVGLSQSFTF